MTTIATVAPPKVGTYDLDQAHTTVNFVARHLVGTKVRGHFAKFDGTIVIADPVEDSSVEAEVDASSIVTGVDMRDEHLRSNDFLDVPNYPTLTLKSTGLTRVSDSQWKLAVDLTIRGVTKAVVFDLEFFGFGPGLQEGVELFAYSASTEIDRRDFGVTFSYALDTGALVVGNKVKIEIEGEAILRK
jgi:polyisoprenoid-binding protein YceI